MSYGKLKRRAKRLNDESEKLRCSLSGSVGYSQFLRIPELSAKHVVVLRTCDFDRGTVRIKKGGYYVLGEDVTLSPNPSNKMKPYPNQTEYQETAYRLGFFAGITVETSEFVVIDLNCKVFKQSKEFALRQRFFNLIELNNQPFIPNQGPGSFGDNLVKAENFVIKNGTLGLSSHSGIHGNGNKNGLIYCVQYEDFEVGGCTLNGCKGVYQVRCTVKNNRKDVPVNGAFSSSLFELEFAKEALKYSQKYNCGYHDDLRKSYYKLDALVSGSIRDILEHNEIKNPEARKLFFNECGLPDGNSYGYLINKMGFAVMGFVDSTKGMGTEGSEDVLLKECCCFDLQNNVTEVLCLWDTKTKKPQTGSTGNLLDVSSSVDMYGYYRKNALSDVIVNLQKVRKELPKEIQKHFGTLNLSDTVLEWTEGQYPLSEYFDSGKLSIKRNGDHQFHVMKGNVGVRVDLCKNLVLKKCRVNGIKNIGCSGQRSSFYGDKTYEYTNAKNGGHPQSSNQVGYNGADSYGVNICASSCVCMDSVDVENIISPEGASVGLGLRNCTSKVFGNEVRSSTNDTSKLPNNKHLNTGLYVSKSVRDYCFERSSFSPRVYKN